MPATPRPAPHGGSTPPCVSLHTIGEARIVVAHATGSVTLTPACDRLFTLALLLGAAPGRPASRSQLSTWLWPDLPPNAARHALRQLLYRLRRLGVPVDGDDDQLRLDARHIAAPDALTATSALPRTGRCLPGWDPPSGALRTWLDGYRATVESRARRALADALGHAVASPSAHIDDHARDARHHRTVLAAALLELDPHDPLARATIPRPHAVRESPPVLRHRCVGRDAVLRTLHAHVAAARAGSGAAVILAARPRTGATRVLEELTHATGLLGGVICHIPDASTTPATVAHQLAATVRHLLGRPGAIGCGADTLRILRQFTATHTLPTGNAVVRRLGAAIAELARALAAERPLLLVVDAPCVAPLERAVASAIARAITDAAALAVFVADPHTAHALRGAAHVVPLYPLAPDAAAELATATARALGASLAPDDRAWCTTMARGRPGDVIALARTCADRPGTRALPPCVAVELHDQLVNLPTRTRQVAALCALIGDTDTADRAAHALHRRPAAVQAALYELRRADLPGVTDVGESHVVQHDIARVIGTAALATFEPAERAVLRARAAAARHEPVRDAPMDNEPMRKGVGR